MNNELINYIEHSFLGKLLKDSEVTDISYNGESLFYLHNTLGRKKSDIDIDKDQIMIFIRQIANLGEKQFSYTVPTLDISEGRYRIHAVHPSIVRVENEKSISFDIRIASKELRIFNDSNFMNIDQKNFLLDALKNNRSIIIGGATGAGKTELQKYLLSSLPDYSRIIVIDNVQELEFVRTNKNLDITSWQINPLSPVASINELIRNALRSNPDWLVVAESRGKEMNDVLNSVMTGHPIITTMHAKSLDVMPHRIVRMIQMSETDEKYEDIMSDLISHIDIYVYVKRIIHDNGIVERFIESIGEIQNGKLVEIFHHQKARKNV